MITSERVALNELRRHIDELNLPVEYGGQLQSQHAAWVESLEACLAADSMSLWAPLPTVAQLPAAWMPDTDAVGLLDPQSKGRWELFRRYDGDEDGRLNRPQLHELLVKDVFGGEMDEAWFDEIWQETTAAAAAAGGAAALPVLYGGDGEAELVDYRGFVRLFDDSGGEEPGGGGREQEGPAQVGSPAVSVAEAAADDDETQAPELDHPEPEPEPELEAETGPGPEPETQTQTETAGEVPVPPPADTAA